MDSCTWRHTGLGGFGGMIVVHLCSAVVLHLFSEAYHPQSLNFRSLDTLWMTDTGPVAGITCIADVLSKRKCTWSSCWLLQISRLLFRENHFKLGWRVHVRMQWCFKYSWAANLRYIFGEGTTCSINVFELGPVYRIFLLPPFFFFFFFGWMYCI